MFKKGTIHDVVTKKLVKIVDDRGWLTELYRTDEIDGRFHPVMSYLSFTMPGITRGPHEHADQADNFAFLGPSDFKVVLWDNRPQSPTFGNRQVIFAGENAPATVLIPPGVVHAYRNVGGKNGMVINLPNRLFAGPGRKEPVDEIRHENDENSPFVLD